MVFESQLSVGQGMKKTSQEEYLAALEEANSAITDDYQDDNAPGFESEAERMAASKIALFASSSAARYSS